MANFGLHATNKQCVHTQTSAHCNSDVLGWGVVVVLGQHKWRAEGLTCSELFRFVSFLYTNNIPLSSLHPSNTKRAPLKVRAGLQSGPMISPGKHVPKEGTLTQCKHGEFSSLWIFFNQPYIQNNRTYPNIRCWFTACTNSSSPLKGAFRRTVPTFPPVCLVTLALRYTLTGIITHPPWFYFTTGSQSLVL